ncbi:MAG: chromosome segregation protein SMC [Candidatus Parabeggiatoa sp. nov. 3]|jgi:predicted ATPase|nr:MAG: chromosome segregation protein SMC [Gammaproteobacteria bacterium]RKZ63544.1 MAG: chromosome segregation protein SMC [Gammaproteobacteria bacterium]
MFNQITLTNYKTHQSTTIKLTPITLLIGDNNSGKTNLLSGIQHFSSLVRKAHPQSATPAMVNAQDFFDHRYRRARDDEEMGISIIWTNDQCEIVYDLMLYAEKKVACRESINVRLATESQVKTIQSGYDKPSPLIALQTKIESETALDESEKQICRAFFNEFSNTFSYHFHPFSLKGLAGQINPIAESADEPISIIPSHLGYDGRYLQEMIHYAQAHEADTFSRCLSFLRRFDQFFHSARYDKEQSRLLWAFDLGQKPNHPVLEEFSSVDVADGFIKAAAIALLASLQHPPALVLLEDIDNDINIGNIPDLIGWIWQASSPKKWRDSTPQYILTSHNPVVLRQFNHWVDHVQTVGLFKRNLFSEINNLSTELEKLIKMGTVDGDVVEDKKGQCQIEIPQYELTRLWDLGTIG